MTDDTLFIDSKLNDGPIKKGRQEITRLLQEVEKANAEFKGLANSVNASLKQLDRLGGANKDLNKGISNLSGGGIGARAFNAETAGKKAQLKATRDQRELELAIYKTKVKQNAEDAKALRNGKSLNRIQQDRVSKNAIANNRRQAGNAELLGSQNILRERKLLGDGGASLLRIQAQLLGNYVLINKALQLMRFGATFVLELDKSFRQLQAITASTNTQMLELRETIISVSEGTKFTAVEVAQAATVLGQAGLSAAQITNSLKDITLLAAAVGADLSKAVTVTTSVMSIFNLTSDNTGHIANVLTGAINNSKLSLDKLALGLQYAGNTAAQAGATFEETVSVLGAMANAGINSGSTLGTGLRQVIISLTKPTKKMTEALSSVGLTMEDVNIESKGLVEVFETLRDAGFGAGKAFQAMRVRAASAFLAVSNNIDVARNLEKSLFLSNAAAEANAVQMKSLSNTFDVFTSILGTFIAQAAEPLKQAIIVIVDTFGGLLQALNKLGPALGVLGAAITGLVAASVIKRLGLMLGSFRDMSFALKALAGQQGIGAAATAFEGLGYKAASTGKKVKGFTNVLKGIPNIVGVAVTIFTLATVAVNAFSNSSYTAAGRLDKLKTSISDLNGQIEEEGNVINTVNERLNRILARYASLSKSSAAVADETLKARIELGKYGLEIQNTAGAPIDSLIDALDRLKDKYRQLQQVNLKKLRQETNDLFSGQVKNSRQGSDRIGTGNLGGIVGTFLGSTREASIGTNFGKDSDIAKQVGSLVSVINGLEGLEDLKIKNLNASEIRKQALEPLEKVQEQYFKTFNLANNIKDEIEKKIDDPNTSTYAKGTARIQAQSIQLLLTQIEDVYKSNIKDLSVAQQAIVEVQKEESLKAEGIEFALAARNLNTKARTLLSELRKTLEGVTDQDLRRDIISKFKSTNEGILNQIKSTASVENADKAEIKRQLQAVGIEATDSLLDGIVSAVTTPLRTVERDLLAASAETTPKHLKEIVEAQSEADEKLLEQTIKNMETVINQALAKGEKPDQGLVSALFAKKEELVALGVRSIFGSIVDGVSNVAQKALAEAEAKGLELELKTYKSNLNTKIAKSGSGRKGRSARKVKQKYIDVLKELENPVDELAKILDQFDNVSTPAARRIAKLQAQINASSEGGPLEGRYDSTQIRQQQAEIQRLELQEEVDALAGLEKVFDEVKLLIDRQRIKSEAATKRALSFGTKAKDTEQVRDALKTAKEEQEKLTTAERESLEIEAELIRIRAELAGKTKESADAATSSTERVTEAIKNWRTENAKLDIEGNVTTQLDTARSSMSSFIVDVTNGTKSISEGFKDMGISILQSLQKMAADRAASEFFGLILGGIGQGVVGANGPQQPSGLAGLLGFNNGGIIPQRAALGFGINTRDSVPILARPGEYVLRNSAVQAIGKDNLDTINAMGNRRRSSSSSAVSGGSSEGGAGNNVVNVYVVAEENMPAITEKDVIATISKDLRNGGGTARLVKSIGQGKI